MKRYEKIIGVIIFLSSATYYSQNKVRAFYGFAINNSIETVVTKYPDLEASNARALGFYYTLGLLKQFDSVFVCQTYLRYGREKSSFEIDRNGVPLKDLYYFSNKTLMVFLSPGLVIDKHHKLFLTLGAGRFYQSDVGGSGVMANGFGQRSYIYAVHLNRNSMDCRLGLKWQVKPYPLKKLNFELGAEASWLYHRSLVEIKSGYNNQPPESYPLNFSVLLFYIGFNFGRN